MTTASDAASFVERIRAHRDAKQLTQTALAERAGLAPAALSRILLGERELRMDHLVALALALETTVTALTHGTDAAEAVAAWVSRARFEEAERSRVAARHARDTALAELAAVRAENQALRRDHEHLIGQAQATAHKLAHAVVIEADLQQLRRHERELLIRESALRARADGEHTRAAEHARQAQAAASQLAAREACLECLVAEVRRLRDDFANAPVGDVEARRLADALTVVLASIDAWPRG